jgi:hypothetical protein
MVVVLAFNSHTFGPEINVAIELNCIVYGTQDSSPDWFGIVIN